MSQKKAKIEPIHLEEAAKLRRIFDARPSPKLSQAKFGEQFDIGSQGVVWQYLNARIPLNVEQAVRFARGLGCAVADFSPRLAAELAELRDEFRDARSSEIGLQPPSTTQNANTGAESTVMGAPEQHLAQLRSDAVIVKVFDARASMGLGLAQPEHDTVVDHIRLTKGWVRTHLPTISGPDSLAVLSAYGDSMSPTFADGDILLVDRGVHDIKVDAVYVLALNNELYIKRIQRRITDGAVIIKSDNPLYDPVVVENGERDGLRVLGRVVWAWNGRKL